MAQQCPIPNQQRPLIDCRDDCVTRFFEHEESYFAENGFFCVVTRKYRWDTCEAGIGIAMSPEGGDYWVLIVARPRAP